MFFSYQISQMSFGYILGWISDVYKLIQEKKYVELVLFAFTWYYLFAI